MSETLINLMLYLTYILFGICVIVAIALPILNLIKNPTNIRSTLIGLGFFVVLFVVSYAFASDAILEQYGDVSTTVSKFAGMGLISLYILFTGAVATILFAEISKVLK